MNLTKYIIENEQTKDILKSIKKPRVPYSKQIVAEPLCTRYSTNIGIAFDYFVRFYVEYLNKEKVYSENKWVAESACKYLKNRKADKIIVNARKAHDKYLKNGEVTNELLRTTLNLAPLDIYSRSGLFDVKSFDGFTDGCIDDLHNLCKLLDEERWTCKNIAVLNPRLANCFVNSNILGAEADIIIDDMLIDIKTTKAPGVAKSDFNQVISYYVLLKILQETELSLHNVVTRVDFNITKVGIYKSRYGELISYNIDDILTNENIDSLKKCFLG